MWLPETAVDIETLEILADHGIKFTILAPNQARQARRRGRQWRNVEGGRVDPKRSYFCSLPSGKQDRSLLLRRTHLTRGGFRKAAEQRRDICESPDERLLPNAAIRN